MTMTQTKTTHTTKNTHTRPEVYGCPRMVWMDVVGYYGTGGHKKKVWEGPNGHGTRYVGTHASDGFLQKQKEQQQTGNKNRKQRTKSTSKSQNTEALTIRSQTPKTAGQKEGKTHETSQINTAKEHKQHKQQKQ